MPILIDLDQVRGLVAEGATLVEVLPAKAYEQLHLPGAINIPLQELDQDGTAGLERNQPVIVYCYDYQ